MKNIEKTYKLINIILLSIIFAIFVFGSLILKDCINPLNPKLSVTDKNIEFSYCLFN